MSRNPENWTWRAHSEVKRLATQVTLSLSLFSLFFFFLTPKWPKDFHFEKSISKHQFEEMEKAFTLEDDKPEEKSLSKGKDDIYLLIFVCVCVCVCLAGWLTRLYLFYFTWSFVVTPACELLLEFLFLHELHGDHYPPRRSCNLKVKLQQ